MTKCIHRGLAGPDDPIYKEGCSMFSVRSLTAYANAPNAGPGANEAPGSGDESGQAIKPGKRLSVSKAQLPELPSDK